MAKNIVIAGDYVNHDIIISGNKFYFMQGLKKTAFIKSDVSKRELITNIEENPFWSAAIRSCVGGMIFGPAGAIIGMASGRKEAEILLSIEFTDGKKSLLSLENSTYKKLMTLIF